MGRELEQKLQAAGITLLGNQPIEQLLIEILKSKNERYYTTIPYLIYTYQPNTKRIYEKTTYKETWKKILTITQHIFLKHHINLRLEPTNKSTPTQQTTQPFEKEFLIQLTTHKPQQTQAQKQEILLQREKEFNLSQIFTPKEKEILKKIQRKEQLTKTQQEYYSRKTKKKLQSILNLEPFAKKILYQK